MIRIPSRRERTEVLFRIALNCKNEIGRCPRLRFAVEFEGEGGSIQRLGGPLHGSRPSANCTFETRLAADEQAVPRVKSRSRESTAVHSTARIRIESSHHDSLARGDELAFAAARPSDQVPSQSMLSRAPARRGVTPV